MATQLPLLVTTDLQHDSASVKRTRAVNQAALAVARKLDTKIELLHVANLGEIAQIPQAANAILESQKAELKNLINPFEGITRARFLVGHPVAATEKLTAKKGTHEMLVQGTRGRTGLSRAFLGSVAEEVLRTSRIPVMTVGPVAQKAGTRPAIGAARKPVILVATDLEKTSSPAEQYALSLARRMGGSVHAVHHLQAGFHPLIQTALSTPSGSRELQGLIRGLREDAENGLKKLEARCRKAKVECSWSLLEKGIHASEALITEIRKSGASLVVLGTHARGLLLGSFLGSTARGVILESPVPVITVRR